MTRMPPPKGTLPVLQFCTPDQLQIDPRYQRTIEADKGGKLVSRIATRWDWALCQTLIVSRRPAADGLPGGLFVVDGQHRLAAARLRGDIQVLPCVVVDHDDVASEAAAFVALNQERRPLTQFALWRASIAAGDAAACAVETIVATSGFTIVGSNSIRNAGELNAIAAIRGFHRVHGDALLKHALIALHEGMEGEVLLSGATILAGLFGFAVDRKDRIDWEFLRDVLQSATHDEWIADINAVQAELDLGRRAAAQAAIERAYDGARALADREAA